MPDMSSETEGDDDDMGGDDSEDAVGDKDDDVDGDDDDLRLSNAEIGTGDEEEKEGGHDSGEEDEQKRHLQLPDAEGEGAVGSILSLSVKSANEDVEKGKAAKQQICMLGYQNPMMYCASHPFSHVCLYIIS